MIRTSLKKGHKWIFVADTSFKLYIGYKQSGAFQHSSFLHGARILAAGLIKIKDGQLRKLSPLSGHVSPPLALCYCLETGSSGEDADYLDTLLSIGHQLPISAHLSTVFGTHMLICLMSQYRGVMLSW
jgi:hypothetical protein